MCLFYAIDMKNKLAIDDSWKLESNLHSAQVKLDHGDNDEEGDLIELR